MAYQAPTETPYKTFEEALEDYKRGELKFEKEEIKTMEEEAKQR